MKGLTSLLAVLGIAAVGYFFLAAPESLQTYYFKTIPVTVDTRADVKVEQQATDQVTFEMINSLPQDKVALTGLVFNSVVETLDQDSIDDLDQQSFQELINKMGQQLPENAVVLRERGFIEQAGQRGYRVLFDLNLNGKSLQMEQRMFVYQGHMLLLMSKHQGKLSDKNTAAAFFDSVAFL